MFERKENFQEVANTIQGWDATQEEALLSRQLLSSIEKCGDHITIMLTGKGISAIAKAIHDYMGFVDLPEDIPTDDDALLSKQDVKDKKPTPKHWTIPLKRACPPVDFFSWGSLIPQKSNFGRGEWLWKEQAPAIWKTEIIQIYNYHFIILYFYGNTIIQKDGIFEMRKSKLYFLPVIPSKSELANFREAGVIVLATRQIVYGKNEKRR